MDNSKYYKMLKEQCGNTESSVLHMQDLLDIKITQINAELKSNKEELQ